MEESEPDVLALAFPRQHRTTLHSTNKIEKTFCWFLLIFSRAVDLVAEHRAVLVDLPPGRPSFMTRVCRFVRCTPSLDRRKLEFPGSSHDGGLDAPSG